MKANLLTLVSLLLLASPTVWAQISEPIGNFNFRVEIDGISAGPFSEVSGLEAEIEVIEFQDGDSNFLRKRPGRAKYGDITLKKGYVDSNGLRDWFGRVAEGTIERRDISITLMTESGEPVRTWNLFGCWPKQWKLGDLNSSDNEVLLEEITLVVEQIRFN